jgi:hypothetical protein
MLGTWCLVASLSSVPQHPKGPTLQATQPNALVLVLLQLSWCDMVHWYNVSYNVRWCDMMHRYWYYNLSWLELVTP